MSLEIAVVNVGDPNRSRVRDWTRSALDVLNDPFFYLLSLPSLGAVLLALAAVIVCIVSPFMFAMWLIVRVSVDGEVPYADDLPIRAFIAMSCIVLFGTCAGIIHRYLTKPEYRGSAISFSPDLRVRSNKGLSFSVMDKRTTQLVCIDIKAEIIIRQDKSDIPIYHFKSIRLDSPGTIALPTEVMIPFTLLCPVPIICSHCGEEGFGNDFNLLVLHHQFYHESVVFTRAKFEKEINDQLANVVSIRIQLAGSDDLSGRTAVAEHVYTFIPGIGDTSLISRKSFYALPSRRNLDISDEDTDTDSTSSPDTKYSPVHVDFMYS
jgi:hypothetical protein